MPTTCETLNNYASSIFYHFKYSLHVTLYRATYALTLTTDYALLFIVTTSPRFDPVCVSVVFWLIYALVPHFIFGFRNDQIVLFKL